MKRKTRIASTLAAAALALSIGTSSAFAHYCTNASKQAGAGSVGTYNVVTETFTPSKRLHPRFPNKVNGGFVTFTDGTHTFDIYMHQTLPEGALAAGPGGDDQCDGQAIDSVLACLGIPHGE